MVKKKLVYGLAALLLTGCGLTGLMGCGNKATAEGRTEIEIVSYKKEAVDTFNKIAARFNETHDDIHLTIDSPNEAMTILKTRFIREDYPDIIVIGGDMDYSNFLDAGLFADISDLDVLSETKSAYLDMDKQLEFIPQDGTYGLSYAANAAGILYNKDMFEQHGWETPETWNEFTALCEQIQSEGVQPLYFGFKDTWTCLAPWNALAVSLADQQLCSQVNNGTTTFTKAYDETAEKMKALLAYGEPNPMAYSYNDACTAFARGQSAMYTIGSYAISQIKSVNPDMNIGTFTFPANEKEADNVLNSGIDVQFCVMKSCENKEAAYEVLRFLYRDDTIRTYLSEQGGIACKQGDFPLSSELEGVSSYVASNRMADFQDHHYPSEMSVDAMIQTYLLDDSADAKETFLNKFDKDWKRYNRDLIWKIQQYNEKDGTSEDTK
ncbi:MAG: extracellular solute-binding protein [Lachnospiraceae bacterium]|nr:extracellular solute-binding protein [Lachnospiraceae bacterium]